MDSAGLRFSSRHFLDLVEGEGIAGTWCWTFATGEHLWSAGLQRLLGLGDSVFEPGFALFSRLVHPQDRPFVDRLRVVDRIGGIGPLTLRIADRNGFARTLSAHAEVSLAPDARPLGARIVLLDVTDGMRLVRARQADRQRRWSLFQQTRSFMFSNTVEYAFDFPHEIFALTGLNEAEVAADAFRTIVASEREHWRALSLEAQHASRIHVATPLVPLAEGGLGRFVVFTVPVRDAAGTVVDWCSVTQPLGHRGIEPADAMLRGLQQAVGGRHLRAARALLGWNMDELARASGVSVATVRRLEEDAAGPASQARHRAVSALRAAGIRFSLMPKGVIACARI